MGDVCACDIHENGRGLSPCMGHAKRIAEHQAMWAALDNLRRGRITADPGDYADTTLSLANVTYWHG